MIWLNRNFLSLCISRATFFPKSLSFSSLIPWYLTHYETRVHYETNSIFLIPSTSSSYLIQLKTCSSANSSHVASWLSGKCLGTPLTILDCPERFRNSWDMSAASAYSLGTDAAFPASSWASWWILQSWSIHIIGSLFSYLVPWCLWPWTMTTLFLPSTSPSTFIQWSFGTLITLLNCSMILRNSCELYSASPSLLDSNAVWPAYSWAHPPLEVTP